MLAEATKGANSPILIEGGKSDHRAEPMMVLAVMVILVIFVFVIFAFKKERGDHGIAEIAGLGLALKHQQGDNHSYGAYNYQMAHDNMRDNLREFGNLKYEIAERTSNTDAKAAQYFYQTEKQILDAKWVNELATAKSEERIINQIKDSEIARKNEEIARLSQSNQTWHIINAIHQKQAPQFIQEQVVGGGYAGYNNGYPNGYGHNGFNHG